MSEKNPAVKDVVVSNGNALVDRLMRVSKVLYYQAIIIQLYHALWEVKVTLRLIPRWNAEIMESTMNFII